MCQRKSYGDPVVAHAAKIRSPRLCIDKLCNGTDRLVDR